LTTTRGKKKKKEGKKSETFRTFYLLSLRFHPPLIIPTNGIIMTSYRHIHGRQSNLVMAAVAEVAEGTKKAAAEAGTRR